MCAVLFVKLCRLSRLKCEMTLHGATLNISLRQRQTHESCSMPPSDSYMKSLHVNINLRVADVQLRLHPIFM